MLGYQESFRLTCLKLFLCRDIFLYLSHDVVLYFINKPDAIVLIKLCCVSVSISLLYLMEKQRWVKKLNPQWLGVFFAVLSSSVLQHFHLFQRWNNALGMKRVYLIIERKALAKRRRKLTQVEASWRKLTQVENLGLLATPFGQGLLALALTCDDLRSLWLISNLHTSQSKFFTIWPPNPSQRKLSEVD